MLTAETWQPDKRRWIKIRPRNEALDSTCYAIAAAFQPAVRVHTWREANWGKLEAQYARAEPAPPPVAAPFSPPKPPGGTAPVRSAVLTRTRVGR